MPRSGLKTEQWQTAVCKGRRSPIATPSSSGPAQPAAEQPQTSAGPEGAVGTVVVIDDDQSARDLLQRQLAKEGFHVLTAAGGEEGLRLIMEDTERFMVHETSTTLPTNEYVILPPQSR